MKNRLLSRLPARQNIVNVFATAAFMVYGWTIYASFWKIPSWMFYLRLDEIFAVYAYSFIVNFIESALLTLGLVFLGFIFSGNLWKDGFISASVISLIIAVVSALLHMRLFDDPNLRVGFIESQVRWWSSAVLIAFVASIAFARVPWLKRFSENLADRFVVFLYLYIPLTILSLGIVIFRTVL